ncbi:MAG TPA: class I SAM-dependent methyltransferase [Streptosporangiaceae bacterium]|jgi:SAM-dependent methyltransferase
MDTERPASAARGTAAYFDQWYADMVRTPERDRIMAAALGLPPEFRPASMLAAGHLAEVTAALALGPGALLADLACGRGSYGIEVARRSGARLAGVDFSQVALNQARQDSAARLPAGRARFQAGTLTATGLADDSADAVLCVDAIQFAAPPLAGLAECRRILRQGGVLVITCWEAAVPGDDRVPARIGAVDLRRDLAAAGFADVQVSDRADWRADEQASWERIVAAIPAGTDDPALGSLRSEGERSLAAFDSLRRVLATAAAP